MHIKSMYLLLLLILLNTNASGSQGEEEALPASPPTSSVPAMILSDGPSLILDMPETPPHLSQTPSIPAPSIFERVINFMSPNITPEEAEELGREYYTKKLEDSIWWKRIHSIAGGICNYGGYLFQSVGNFLPIMAGFQGVETPAYDFSGDIIAFIGMFIKPGETHFELLARDAEQEIKRASEMLGIDSKSDVPQESHVTLTLPPALQAQHPSLHESEHPDQSEIIKMLHQYNLGLYHTARRKESWYKKASIFFNYLSYTGLSLSTLFPVLKKYEFIDTSSFSILAGAFYFTGVLFKPGQSYFQRESEKNRHAAEAALAKALAFKNDPAATTMREDLDDE